MGALTSKPFAFKARSWELTDRYGYDVIDIFFSPIKVSVRGSEIIRVLPDTREGVISEWISDKTRFSYDSYYNLEAKFFDFCFVKDFTSRFNFSNFWVNFYFKRNSSTLLYDYNVFDFYTALKAKSAIAFSGVSLNSFYSDYRPSIPTFNIFAQNVIFAGVNIRYQLPTFCIHLRKISFINNNNINFFNLGFFTNNLLGEINIGSSVSIFFHTFRSKSRFSRSLSKNSVFYANFGLYRILKSYFDQVYCVFDSPLSSVSSEINFSFLKKSDDGFLKFYFPHYFKTEGLHIRNNFFTVFPALLSASPKKHKLFFTNKKVITSNFFNFYNHFNCFFTYSNYFTYYSFNKYSSNSNNSLLSLTRQTLERSSFSYYY